MKRFNLMLTLMIASFCISAKATVINETDHYFCGFDTEEEFNQWKMFDLNGADANGNNSCWWDWDWKAAMFSVGTKQAADEWLISPSVTLLGNKKYVAKISLTSGGSKPKKFKFTMGGSQDVEGQTVILKDIDPDVKEYTPGDYYIVLDLPESIVSGTYNFGIYSNTNSWGGATYIKSFEVVENNDGAINFVCVDKEDSTVQLANVAVTLSGPTFEAKTKNTNETGSVEYSNLTPGSYSVEAFVDGYYPTEKISVNVEANTTTTFTIELEKGLTSTVSGVVVDEDGNGIENAIVKLSGIKDYEAATDYWGEFYISKVRQGNKYQLSVSADSKRTYMAQIDVNQGEVSLGNIVLKDIVDNPVNVKAEVLEQCSMVSWMMPTSPKEFIAGTADPEQGEYELNSGYTVVGNAFREPMLVRSISWMNSKPASVSDATVDVYIYPVNEDGSISINPCFTSKNVSTNYYDETSDNNEWNIYEMTEPVVAPNGCVIAIGHEKSIIVRCDYSRQGNSVALTNLDSEWRVTSASCFLIKASGSNVIGEFSSDSKLTKQLKVTAKDKALAKVKNLPADGYSFTAWRFNVEDVDAQDNWTVINENIKNMYVLDKDFTKLPQGTYRYAVQTIYDNGKKSAISFSPEIEHELYTNLTLNVFTNTAVDMADGALVSITNNATPDNSYSAIVENNVATFNNLRKGSYNATVSKEGFANKSIYSIALDAKDSYSEEVTLELVPEAPYNLAAEQSENSTDVMLSWNNVEKIYDDFENMEDFAINPAGELGWSYLDADGKNTYGISQCQNSPYPNMFEPKAFMAFNPNSTTPNTIESYQPHSGNKMLVSVAPEDGSANDDYMFSPELNFESGFNLEFYAASGIFAALGKEKFMVGYTTSDTSIDNIIWITKTPQSVGGAWTHFSYRMPKDAKHTVIRCVSEQCMFFMIDDVTIGTTEPEVFNMAMFNVELDGEQIATTNQRSILLNSLEGGKHIAKIQTVYHMSDDSKKYSTQEEIVFYVDKTSGITENFIEELYKYENSCIIPGAGVSKIELYTVQGIKVASCDNRGQISTSDIEKGIYILSIEESGVTRSVKIVVK